MGNYISQLLIQPSMNGNYFYELATNCMTGSSAPNWNMAMPGTLFLPDNNCEWVDIATSASPGIPGVGSCSGAI